MKKFNLKTLMAACALAAAALAAAPSVLAHGDGVPKHGGVVKSANDLAFELAPGKGGAEVYIDDHGQALPTANFAGKLTVLGAGGKSETVLKPAGDKLVAAGVTLKPGDKAVVVVTNAGQTTSVRFTLP